MNDMNAENYRDILALLLPPVSYNPKAPRLSAELLAEAVLLSRAGQAGSRLLTAITLTRAMDFLPDQERVYALSPSPNDTLQQRCQRVLAK
ncbi:DUF2313 domain-containing protein, partial [Salmonella enterica subsp. salamae]|nr:DUF2313 domain-containing protein [Salmonella enterica subsp. salamae]